MIKYLSIRCWLVCGNRLHWCDEFGPLQTQNLYSNNKKTNTSMYIARTWNTFNSVPQSVCCEYLRNQLRTDGRGEIHYWFRIECVTLKHWYWIIMGILLDTQPPLSFDTDTNTITTTTSNERLRCINAFRNLHGFCMNDVLFHAIQVDPKLYTWLSCGLPWVGVLLFAKFKLMIVSSTVCWTELATIPVIPDEGHAQSPNLQCTNDIMLRCKFKVRLKHLFWLIFRIKFYSIHIDVNSFDRSIHLHRVKVKGESGAWCCCCCCCKQQLVVLVHRE